MRVAVHFVIATKVAMHDLHNGHMRNLLDCISQEVGQAWQHEYFFVAGNLSTWVKKAW